MTKVKYVPEPDMPLETSQFGYSFSAGKQVEVDDAHALFKFSGNRFFHVENDAKDTEVEPKSIEELLEHAPGMHHKRLAAQAKRFLGDDAPSGKDDVIAALAANLANTK